MNGVVVTEVRMAKGRKVSRVLKDVTVIASREDEIAFEKKLMKEAGVDEAGWFMKTDPRNPPFKAGDKVWIESMAGGFDSDMIPKLREPQTVESLIPVPCSDVPMWSVDLVGIPYIFSQYDLRKA